MDKIIRFVIVGVIAFCVDASILSYLTNCLKIHYLLSGTISFTIACFINYICSSKWVFGHSNFSKSKECSLFFVLSVCGLVIQNIVLYVFYDFMCLPLLFAKIVATIVAMVFNYVSRKKLLCSSYD